MALKRIPGYLDRYPAKMVSRLARSLIRKHCDKCTVLLDPFCGSGAIVTAAASQGISTRAWDINPYAALLTSVKTSGFNKAKASRLLDGCVRKATAPGAKRLDVRLPGATYWFTPATLGKFERLRASFKAARLHRTRDGRAVLLACALAVRLCSRADQRSPKPFISRSARKLRKGRHFDPNKYIPAILDALSSIYPLPKRNTTLVRVCDVRRARPSRPFASHVVTSPPYLNAQDYYRNSKLELAVLDGLIPFDIAEVRNGMIGTERGSIDMRLTNTIQPDVAKLLRGWHSLIRRRPREAWIVARYIRGMESAVKAVDRCLKPGGTFVLVCGDNLVAGVHIRTSRVLTHLITSRLGYVSVSATRDRIKRRYLAPRRMGHRSIIKTEIISVFVKPTGSDVRRVSGAAAASRKAA